MKSLLLLFAFAVSAFAAPPTPIAPADVPNNVSANISAQLKIGIADAYNKAVAAEYAALTPAQQAAYTPPTVNAYILARMGEVFGGYTKQVFDADLAAQKAADKWGNLTQAQRDQIKAIFATVP